jgi:hypothetical protein
MKLDPATDSIKTMYATWLRQGKKARSEQQVA